MLEKVSLLNATHGWQKLKWMRSNLRNNQAKANKENDANVTHTNNLVKDLTTPATGSATDDVGSIS